MASQNNPYGSYVLKSATGNVKASAGQLLGFYVNNTSSGTITLYDDASTGTTTAISGLITPAIGWHPYPIAFVNGLGFAIGSGTISLTFVVA